MRKPCRSTACRSRTDLHGEGDHLLAHAEPQRGDRAGFISSAMTLTQPRMTWSKRWRERLPRQQRPAALHGKIDRGERPGTGARFQERRPAAVNDKD
jgi:hypothetical protein